MTTNNDQTTREWLETVIRGGCILVNPGHAHEIAAAILAELSMGEKWNYDLDAAPTRTILQVTVHLANDAYSGPVVTEGIRYSEDDSWHGGWTWQMGKGNVIAWRPLPAPAPAQPKDGAAS